MRVLKFPYKFVKNLFIHSRLLGEIKSPSCNDPLFLVYVAFRNIYPLLNCIILFESNVSETGSCSGYVCFRRCKAIPVVVLFREHSLDSLVVTLMRGLAYVAAGPEHRGDAMWKDALLKISNEYSRLCDVMYGERWSSISEEVVPL